MTEQIKDQEQTPKEVPAPVTPPRTFVNAGMSGSYAPTWGPVRTGADDNKRYNTKGNST